MKTSNPAGNKNVQIIFFAVLLGVLLLVKLISGYNPETNGKTIRVYEADGQTAMKDVRVSILLNEKVIYQTASDKEGEVKLPSLSTPGLTIQFQADGYITEKLVNQKIDTMRDSIRLFKEAVLKGKITRKKDDTPVSGARLTLWGPERDVETVTDRQGNYYFAQLKSGYHTLQLKTEGYALMDAQQFEIQSGQTLERNYSVQTASLVTGKILDKETNRPLKNIYVTLYGNNYYNDTTDADGFFSFANVLPGNYQLQVYHEGFKQLQTSTIVVQEGASVLNQTFLLEPLEPQFQIYTYQQVFLPGEKIQTKIRSYRISGLDCKLYRITSAELRAQKGTWLRPSSTVLEDRKPVAAWTKKIDIQDITRWQTRTISFPVSQKGFYILEISGIKQTKIVPFISTDLALIAKEAPDRILVWSHSLRNSAPIASTRIDVEQNQFKTNESQASKEAGITGTDGLLNVPLEKGSARIWGFRGEDVAYVELSSGADLSNQIKGYIYTDRPVYRPGHTVHFKGILRKEVGDVYQVVNELSCPLLIRDSTGSVVQQQQITTSAHGSFSGEFTLADEPALGTYRIELQTTGNPSGEFKVLEYRKPEFSIQVLPENERYFNNETVQATVIAKYYFGAPVSNQTVEYTVLDSPYYSWDTVEDYDYDDESYDYGDYYSEGEYYGYGRVITSGSIQLDANGQATISFPATKEGFDRYYSIEAKITDQSRREVTGSGRVLIIRGEYKIGIQTDSYVYSAGEKMLFKIRTTDYDDHPVSLDAEITGSYQHWDETKRQYTFKQSWTNTLHTDRNGRADVPFTASQSGYARVDVTVHDTKNNQITSTCWIWISGNDDFYSSWNGRTLDLIPDQKKKQPGERTKVLIHSSQSNAYALVTFEGKLLHKAEVIRLKNSTKLLSFTALPEYAPTLWVSVTFTSHKEFYNRSIPIQVSAASKFLKIDIKSDKQQYKPREIAKYQIKITDAAGEPVSTEFSLSMVDESIYAISPELVPDIQKFFYGPSPNLVQTYYSFAPRYLGGADKDGNKQIRKDFPDTAFWTASAQTDASGIGRLEIKLPDSLTTWRATVRAANDQTLVGSAIQKIIATKTLIARLETPRFFTVGDSITVTGVFHNLSTTNLNVKVSLTEDDKLRGSNSTAKNIALNPNEIKRVDWLVQVVTAGTIRLILKADAGSDFDGMQLDVPVYPFGIQRLKSFSGQTSTSVNTNFEINADENFPSSTLQLYLTPSVAGMAFDSLEYLTGYPYGCVEQTMSRFLPDLIVQQALKQLNLPNAELTKELPKQINAGLQRLYHFQHDDGGWGWWENDETNPYMTAYVIYGLSLASKNGYSIDPDRFQRGVEALKTIYGNEQNAKARAYMLYSLSESAAASDFVTQKLTELGKLLDQFDSYSLSAFTLTALNNKNETLTAEALKELKTKASVSETYAFWLPNNESYGWCDNKIETSAYALRALLKVEPGSPLIPKVVRWLAEQREGDRWESTKDTAATIISLMEYVQRSNELKGNYIVHVTLNGKASGEFSFAGMNLWNQRKELDFHADNLRKGTNELGIQIDGTGVLYYSAQLRYFEDGKKVSAANEGVQLNREYFRYKRVAGSNEFGEEQSELLKGHIKVGEEILVKLTVQASKNLEYVIVEDPLPSGFEVVTNPGDYYEWTYWYCGRQIRDEKIAFFSTWLYEGKREIYYIIRAESPGSLHVSPTQSWAMYLPEIRGNGVGNFLAVKD